MNPAIKFAYGKFKMAGLTTDVFPVKLTFLILKMPKLAGRTGSFEKRGQTILNLLCFITLLFKRRYGGENFHWLLQP
jgi:hypothetical protein